MKTLIVTTLTTMALCVACSTKDTTSTPDAHAATAAPAENQGPSAAQAVLKSAKKQKVKGTVHFTRVGDKIKVEANLTGLKPGSHGFHIHEKGDCSVADFSSAGGHYNPNKLEHAGPDAHAKHVGDMGNIVADKKGNATYSMEFSDMVMSGETSIIGKAVIVHDGADDFHTQPTGNAGGRAACGVIEEVK